MKKKCADWYSLLKCQLKPQTWLIKVQFLDVHFLCYVTDWFLFFVFHRVTHTGRIEDDGDFSDFYPQLPDHMDEQQKRFIQETADEVGIVVTRKINSFSLYDFQYCMIDGKFEEEENCP